MTTNGFTIAKLFETVLFSENTAMPVALNAFKANSRYSRLAKSGG